MNRQRARAWLGVTAILIVGGAIAAGRPLAVTATAQGMPDGAPDAIRIEPSATTPPGKAAQGRRASGNPLWAVPLASLTATSERPLFLPSRRPPAPVVAAPPPRVEPAGVEAPPAPPERPPLDLVGTITGASERIAIFTDTTTSNVVRLKTGEGLDRWVLRSVARREATLQRDSDTAILVLQTTGNAVPSPRVVRIIPPRAAVTIPPRLAARLPPRVLARFTARLSGHHSERSP